MSDQPNHKRDAIHYLGQALAQHSIRLPEAALEAIVGYSQSLLMGLLCWPCLHERPEEAGRTWEWRAITIIDGTALCEKHIIAKLRQEAEGDG
jgi:hypothetical protein